MGPSQIREPNMQVPSVLETQAHLRALNFSLEGIRADIDHAERYQLRDPRGSVWGHFDSLVAFWAMWLGYASEVLSEGRRIQQFIQEFADASEDHRREMVGWHEGRLSNLDPEPLRRWLSQFPDFSPDNLPPDWADQLESNLNGWIGGRRATRCMIEKMAEIDAGARDRFRRLPAKIGVPELQLVD